MNAPRADSDCLPEPPTPINNAWPDSAAIILVILHTCFIASSNNTKSITALVSLYSLRASCNLC